MLLKIPLAHTPEAADILLGLLRQRKVGIEKTILLGVSDTTTLVCLIYNDSSVYRLVPLLA